MTSNVVSLFRTQPDLHSQDELLQHFESDLIDLFSGKRQGHLEKWEYTESEFAGDPAGGAAFWQELIRFPGQYYLPHSDIMTLARASSYPAIEVVLRSISTIVELGPGSAESISCKTYPFLRHAQSYIAVDQTAHQAQSAAAQVRMAMGINASHEVSHYHYPNIAKNGRSKTGFVMWGGSVANIEGKMGADPLPGLLKTLRAFADTCNQGDVYFVTFDTETNGNKVTAAYNEKLLSRKFLSVLFAAKKLNLINGDFRPGLWTHKSVWHAQSQQCAHYFISGADQSFSIAGKHFSIKTGQSFISNNSYKFTSEQMMSAAKAAGFSRAFITDDRPMALLIATK